MALDLSRLTTNVAALSGAVQGLVDLTTNLAAEHAKAAEAAAAAVAADEASAVAALTQVSDHLAALVTSINAFVAGNTPAAPAPAAAPDA